MPNRFNLRVYAIIIKDGSVLMCDECINDFCFTKFPGGGVELGEGIVDALKRELIEEGNITIDSAAHFYTTDFFQLSAFKPDEQIVSVYYKVNANINWQEKHTDESTEKKKHTLRLYFKSLPELKKEDFTFPIDRVVFEKLQQT